MKTKPNNIKKVVGILFLLNSMFLFTQVPNDIKDKHDQILDFYKNENKSLLKKDVTKLTAEMGVFYDSITEYYRYYGTKKNVLKGVRFYTDNDFFAFIDNRDHEYTGSFRLELITDYFGLKLFSFRREHLFLSYQSVLFGFDLYTPDIIDVKNIADLDKRDRPFASFQYFGRSRNIIRYDGKYRSSGVLKIGLIGGNISKNFQRFLHRDIIDSENNNGWDYQIANGGRLAIQYDLSNEWQTKVKNKNRYFNYGFETKIGFEKFSITPTLAVTNKSFFEKNPHYAINSKNPHFGTQQWGQQFYQSMFFDAKLESEIVFYNSMLQGYITKNKEFKFNDSTNLNEEIPLQSNINTIVGRLHLGLGFRNYNSTFMFEYFIQTPEYDYSWKNKYFHKYARISFTMNI